MGNSRPRNVVPQRPAGVTRKTGEPEGISGLPKGVERSTPSTSLLLWLALCLLGACSEERAQQDRVVFEADVQPLLKARCQECHGPERAEGGYRVDSYLNAIACAATLPLQPVVQPAAERAPLLRAIQDETHAGILSTDEQGQVRAWVFEGAALRRGGVHGPGILLPGAADFHGALVAEDHYAALRDEEAVWACGQCHAGAPVPAVEPKHVVPGATDCRTCHTEGVLGCQTCHGGNDEAYPQGPACFDAPPVAAHRLHLESAWLGKALTCNSCHPAADRSLSGTHGDGQVQVRFALGDLPEGGTFDASTMTCAVYCHGESRPDPRWVNTQSTCDSCHDSPPEPHYAGRCDACHGQLTADGTDLLPGDAHLNGKLDLGDGEGCGACHGAGPEGWPSTPSHEAHHITTVTVAVQCTTCHTVPKTVTAAGHLDPSGAGDPAEVRLTDTVASAEGAPRYGSEHTCADQRCHGTSTLDGVALRWDSDLSLDCASCHGAPPPLPHPQDEGCDQLHCHGGEVGPAEGGRLRITEAGRALHMNGAVDSASVE